MNEDEAHGSLTREQASDEVFEIHCFWSEALAALRDSAKKHLVKLDEDTITAVMEILEEDMEASLMNSGGLELLDVSVRPDGGEEDIREAALATGGKANDTVPKPLSSTEILNELFSGFGIPTKDQVAGLRNPPQNPATLAAKGEVL